MSRTYTRWIFSSETGLTGDIHIKAQDSFQAPTFTFTFPNGDYLAQDSAEANAAQTYLLAGDMALYLLEQSNLEEQFPDDTNTQYFNSAGENIAYRQTGIVDAVYHYEITQGADIEKQYIVIMPAIEAAISTLAKKLLDSQCNCQVNASVMDNFVKAKAMQQLIYAMVQDQGTDLSAEFLQEINAQVSSLTGFLAGTNDLCGC